MMALAQSHQLLLYDDPHSEYCAKVKVALHYKGLTWKTLAVGPCGTTTRSSQFQQHAPLGKIPALVIRMTDTHPDRVPPPAPQAQAQAAAAAASAGARATAAGAAAEAAGKDAAGEAVAVAAHHTEVVLYESEVINEWLQEAYPHPSMLPQSPLLRAQARLISRFHDLYLEPALCKLYPLVAPHACSSSAAAAAGQEFLQHLRHLDQQLLLPGARLALGDSLSLADCGYPGLLLYAQLLFPVLGLGQLEFETLGLPRVAAWHAALLEQAAIQAVLRELQPAAQHWLDTKLSS